MKKKKLSLPIALLLVITLLLTSAIPVFADPGETVRVWVKYKDGKATEVLGAINSVKSQVHFDFPELGAYVITLPRAALNGIVNNPNVLDVEEDAERYPILDKQAEVTAESLAVLDATGQTVPYGIDMVQARDVWDANRDGVVDSGAPTGARL